MYLRSWRFLLSFLTFYIFSNKICDITAEFYFSRILYPNFRGNPTENLLFLENPILDLVLWWKSTPDPVSTEKILLYKVFPKKIPTPDPVLRKILLWYHWGGWVVF